MPPPELPADKSLQRGVALVHERAPAAAARRHGVAEAVWLPVVEDVTLAVVGRRAAGGLVAELGAPLDGQRLQHATRTPSCSTSRPSETHNPQHASHYYTPQAYVS